MRSILEEIDGTALYDYHMRRVVLLFCYGLVDDRKSLILSCSRPQRLKK
jgi:hypothetical protein